MLRIAVQHAAHTLKDMIGRSIKIKDLRLKTRPINHMMLYADGSDFSDRLLECSALAETGNLILSSFLNALAEFAEVPLLLSSPAIRVDMLTTILEAAIISLDPIADEVWVIETYFVNIESELSVRFLVLLEPSGLTVH